MRHLHPFSKIFSGRPRNPPSPYCEKIKNSPSLAWYYLLQLRWKFSRITYIERSELWRQKLHTIFGKKSTRTRQKNALRMHHLHPFFKNFPGGGPPDPHLREGVSPSPTLPLRRFAPIWLRPPAVDPLDPPLQRIHIFHLIIFHAFLSYHGIKKTWRVLENKTRFQSTKNDDRG